MDKPALRQNSAAHIEAGMNLKKERRFSEAADCFGEAIAAGENTRQLRFERAVCLLQSGRAAEAHEALAFEVRQTPGDAAAVHLLGVALKKLGRFAEAVEKLEEACCLMPNSADPPRNLGNAYVDMQNFAAGEAAYRKAATLQPGFAENWRLIGYTLSLQGKQAEAAEMYRKCLSVDAHHDGVFIDYTGTLCNLREFEKAEAELAARDRALPGDWQTLVARAWFLKLQGRLEEAIAALGRAIEKNPNRVQDLLAMGRFLEPVDREKANAYFRRAVEVSRRALRPLSRLSASLNRTRGADEPKNIQEAYTLACEMADRFPNMGGEADTAWDLFLRCADYPRLAALPDKDALMRGWLAEGRIEPFWTVLGRVKTPEDRIALVDNHRKWGERVMKTAAEHPVKRPPARTGNGRIRVGIVSSDLRNHPVTYFALPLFEHFDRDRFEVYAYSFYTGEEDPLQKHIRGHATEFRLWPHRSNADAAQGIADDRLDILFELGGPTDMNKPQVMAWKPAPVQVSWLGYPHSLGIPAIDYILVDPYLKPEDPRMLVEKPFELAESWVSLGRTRFHDEFAITPGLPEERNGTLTFGTMNNPNKYTPELVETWAKVLQEVPQSRFLFVRPEGAVPAFRENMAKEFARHGIAAERLAYIPVRGNNMPYYNEIDIALDAFPHVGGTTTCETLWMGVPVVTLVGAAFFERLSYSNLSNAGLGDLCAFTRDEYVAKAVELSADVKRRSFLRQNLRALIRRNPLGQTERFADNFYKKIEEVLS